MVNFNLYYEKKFLENVKIDHGVIEGKFQWKDNKLIK
jgi:hypothetical protein